MAVFICQGCGAEHASWEGKCPECGVQETIRLAPSTDRMVDKVVRGKFKIVRKLGQGGMGAVYLAEQVGIGQRVALKFLKSEFSSDVELARRFLNEAKSYARVAHPNAVTLHDFGQDEEGNLFIAMEYCEGVDLKKVIAESGRLPIAEAVEIVLQVADVLATAHSRGIVHRDLKPENIMIRRGMRGVHAKVLDFGIARLMGEGTRLTVAGAIAGTPRYMSPEQVEGKDVDHRADIYALGILCFEALTGKQPFDGATIAEILRKQVVEPMPHLVEMHAELDFPEIDKVLQKACAKKPDDRWPDLLTFASALSQALPTQAHLSMPPLQRTGLSFVGETATPRPELSGVATPGARLDDASSTAQTLVKQPTAVNQTVAGVEPKSIAGGATVTGGESLLGQRAVQKSKAPMIFVALAAVVGLGAIGYVTMGPKPPAPVVEPPPKPVDPPVDPNATAKPPPKADNDLRAIQNAVAQAAKTQNALNNLTNAKTEFDIANLDAAEKYLQAVEDDTQYAPEAKKLLGTIERIRDRLKVAQGLRSRGQCEQALPVFQEVLDLNPKLKDALSGRAACKAGTIDTTAY